MRPSIPLLIGLLVIAPIVHAQSVATRSAPTQSAVGQAAVPPSAAGSSAASVHERKAAAHLARRARKQRVPLARATDTAHGGAPTGVLALGASDITGNKELPKVMVIVPWKDSLGAGGVIKPTDSLMDEVLQPVDRGVFQRQIRYYGQLGAAPRTAAVPRPVAPVGDSH